MRSGDSAAGEGRPCSCCSLGAATVSCAAERGAASDGASGDAAGLSLAARAGGGDGDEDVIARLAAGDGALPRVLEEAQAHGAARL